MCKVVVELEGAAPLAPPPIALPIPGIEFPLRNPIIKKDSPEPIPAPIRMRGVESYRIRRGETDEDNVQGKLKLESFARLPGTFTKDWPGHGS